MAEMQKLFFLDNMISIRMARGRSPFSAISAISAGPLKNSRIGQGVKEHEFHESHEYSRIGWKIPCFLCEKQLISVWKNWYSAHFFVPLQYGNKHTWIRAHGTSATVFPHIDSQLGMAQIKGMDPFELQPGGKTSRTELPRHHSFVHSPHGGMYLWRIGGAMRRFLSQKRVYLCKIINFEAKMSNNKPFLVSFFSSF